MWRKKRKTCNTKVLTTEEDDDDLLQSYTDQLTINEVSEEKDLISDNEQHTNNEVSEETDLIIGKTKNDLDLGHSEENKTDELEREFF